MARAPKALHVKWFGFVSKGRTRFMGDIERQMQRFEQEAAVQGRRIAQEVEQRDQQVRLRLDEYVTVLQRNGLIPQHLFLYQRTSRSKRRLLNPEQVHWWEESYTYLGLGWPVDGMWYDPEFASAENAGTYYYVAGVAVFGAKPMRCPERLGKFKTPGPGGSYGSFGRLHEVYAPKDIHRMTRPDGKILVVEPSEHRSAQHRFGFDQLPAVTVIFSDEKLVEFLASQVRRYTKLAPHEW
jgi:hypothetical protein